MYGLTTTKTVALVTEATMWLAFFFFFYPGSHANTPDFYERSATFFLSYPEAEQWNVDKPVVWWAKPCCHSSTPTSKGRNDKWNAEPLTLGQIKYALKIDRVHVHHSPHCRPPIYQLSPGDNSPQLPGAMILISSSQRELRLCVYQLL